MSPKREFEKITLKIHFKEVFERTLPGYSIYLYPLSVYLFKHKSVEFY